MIKCGDNGIAFDDRC